jgi:hypothetical protein
LAPATQTSRSGFRNWLSQNARFIRILAAIGCYVTGALFLVAYILVHGLRRPSEIVGLLFVISVLVFVSSYAIQKPV